MKKRKKTVRLLKLGIQVATSAPITMRPTASGAIISRSLIEALRRELVRQGVDWRAIRAKVWKAKAAHAKAAKR